VSGASEPEDPGAARESSARSADHGERLIPVVEERARIETHAVETGRVRVSTRTETVEQLLREHLRSDAVSVTRVPIGRTLAEGEAVPAMREEGGVTVIPILEEILVVEKRLVLKEEVHIRQTSAEEVVEVPVSLRRQRAVVERVDPEGHASEQTVPPSAQETSS